MASLLIKKNAVFIKPSDMNYDYDDYYDCYIRFVFDASRRFFLMNEYNFTGLILTKIMLILMNSQVLFM